MHGNSTLLFLLFLSIVAVIVLVWYFGSKYQKDHDYANICKTKNYTTIIHDFKLGQPFLIQQPSTTRYLKYHPTTQVLTGILTEGDATTFIAVDSGKKNNTFNLTTASGQSVLSKQPSGELVMRNVSDSATVPIDLLWTPCGILVHDDSFVYTVVDKTDNMPRFVLTRSKVPKPGNAFIYRPVSNDNVF